MVKQKLLDQLPDAVRVRHLTCRREKALYALNLGTQNKLDRKQLIIGFAMRPFGQVNAHVIELWEYFVNIFTMRNPLANHQLIGLIYRHAHSVFSDTDFVFIWIASHVFKIPAIKWVSG